MDEVTFLKILQDGGIKHERRGNEIWYQCPLPGHNNEDRNYSASYSLRKGQCNCFVHGGGISNVIAHIKNIPICDAKKITKEISKTMDSVIVKNELDEFLQEKTEKFASEYKLKEYCKLIHKKYTFENFTDKKELIKKFEIGYDEKTKRLTFPLRDKNGKLILIFKRSVIDEDPRYINEPKDTEKSNYIYGIDLWDNPEYLIVVEAPKSVIRSVHNGIENVVAIIGSKPSNRQIDILLKKAKTLYIAMDDDRAGKEGENIFKEYCKKYEFDLRFVCRPNISKYQKETGNKPDWANYTTEEMEHAKDNADRYFNIGAFNV